MREVRSPPPADPLDLMASPAGFRDEQIRAERGGAAQAMGRRRRWRGAFELRDPGRLQSRDGERSVRDERKRDGGDRGGPAGPVPLPIRPEERDEKKEYEREEWKTDDDERLRRRRDQREDGKVSEEIPVRARIREHIRGVRGLPESGRPDRRGENDNCHDREGRDQRVAPRGVRPERDPAPQDLGV